MHNHDSTSFIETVLVIVYFNRLQELQERGWVDQLVRQRINNGTVCQLPPGKEEGQRPAKPLTLSQMWGVFAIMGVGE